VRVRFALGPLVGRAPSVARAAIKPTEAGTIVAERRVALLEACARPNVRLAFWTWHLAEGGRSTCTEILALGATLASLPNTSSAVVGVTFLVALARERVRFALGPLFPRAPGVARAAIKPAKAGTIVAERRVALLEARARCRVCLALRASTGLLNLALANALHELKWQSCEVGCQNTFDGQHGMQ